MVAEKWAQNFRGQTNHMIYKVTMAEWTATGPEWRCRDAVKPAGEAEASVMKDVPTKTEENATKVIKVEKNKK